MEQIHGDKISGIKENPFYIYFILTNIHNEILVYKLLTPVKINQIMPGHGETETTNLFNDLWNKFIQQFVKHTIFPMYNLLVWAAAIWLQIGPNFTVYAKLWDYKRASLESLN